MNNNDSLEFFYNMSKSVKDNINCVKLAKNSDYTDIDARFILKYVDKHSNLLDIGSGTGLIVNKIYDKVKSIECIEPFKDFSQYIVKSQNVFVIDNNIFEYKTSKIFDAVVIFGTMHYFNKDEAMKVYEIVHNLLKQGGRLIIKNQFGISEDVTVAGYSEEQKTNYFASYRQIDKELALLKSLGYKNIETFDIYPKEANRWTNTHFYAIVAEV